MNALMRVARPDLEHLARHYLRRERADHTLDTQALVHESYIRLVRERKVVWQNRKHFFGVAAQHMRRVLCDYARGRNSFKRGGPGARRPVSIAELDAELAGRHTGDPDLPLLIDGALARLEAHDADAAELIRLRYFAGFTLVEIAEILDIPTRTLSRKWRFARAWLSHDLNTEK